jgi:hypothetical protein
MKRSTRYASRILVNLHLEYEFLKVREGFKEEVSNLPMGLPFRVGFDLGKIKHLIFRHPKDQQSVEYSSTAFWTILGFVRN